MIRLAAAALAAVLCATGPAPPVAVQPPADAEDLAEVLDAHVEGGRWAEAVAAGERALPAAEAAGDTALLVRVLAAFASACNRAGDHERTIALLSRLVGLQEWTNPGSTSHVDNLVALADLLRARGRPAEAEVAARRAVDLARALPAAASAARLAGALTTLAGALIDAERLGEAEVFAREAVALAAQAAPGTGVERDAVRALRNALLFARSRTAELRTLSERALSLSRAVYGDASESIQDLRGLAYACWLGGEPEQALANLREAVEIARRLPPGSLAGWDAFWNLGQMLEQLGRLEEAEALDLEALAALEAGHAGEDPRRSVTGSLAGVRAKRAAAARPATSTPGGPDPRIAKAADLRARGEAAIAAKRWAEALPLLEEARELYRVLSGGDTEEAMELAGGLREALAGMKRWPEAAVRAEEALALARARPAPPARLLVHLREAAATVLEHARHGGPATAAVRAEVLAREAVELGRTVAPEDKKDRAYDLRVHAVALEFNGRTGEGIDVMTRAVALAREAGITGEADLGLYERDLLTILDKSNREIEALPLAAEREARLAREQGEGSDDHLEALERLAGLQEWGLGWGRGLPAFRRGLRLCASRHPAPDACDDPWRDRISEALGTTGHSAEALAMVEAILDRHAREGRTDPGDQNRRHFAGIYAFNLGDTARAARHARAYLPTARAAGRKGWELADAACKSAESLSSFGLEEEATDALVEGWALARELPVVAREVSGATATLLCLANQARFRHVDTERLDPRAVAERAARLLDEVGAGATANRASLLQLRAYLARTDAERDAIVAEAEQFARDAPELADRIAPLLEDAWTRRGEWERLLPRARARLESTRRFSGAGSRFYTAALLGLAEVLLPLGKVDEAVPLLREALDIEVRALRSGLAVLSEKSMADALWAESSLADDLLEAALADPRHIAVAAAAVLASRGRIFDALAGTASLAAGRARDPGLAPLSDALRTARQRRADLALRPPPGLAPKAVEREKARLAREAALLEAELRARMPEAARLPPDPSPAEVVKQLDAAAAFVDVHLWSGSRADSRSGAPHERRYVAFVYRRGAAPTLVDLGPAAEIDGAVDEVRRAVTSAERRLARAADPAEAERELEAEYRAAAAALYALAVAPLEPALAGAHTLHIAPDGALARVPFEALVASEDGPYLVEGREFASLTSARDLVRPPRKGTGRGVDVIAGPDFDLLPVARRARMGAGVQVASLEPVNAPGSAMRAIDLRGGRWDRLAGAAAEAGDVVAALGGTRYAPVRVIAGAEADEAVVKSLAAPRILHVATHGFFLPVERDEDRTAEAAGLDSGAVRGSARLRREANPMLRSGLVLSGANAVGMEGGEGLEDGWLTAEEVALLDLGGTDLVVLSACETGLGEVGAGMGVRGLRSAFLRAGARTLVTSLYKVPDAETRSLMRAFYGGLARGEGKLQALRGAELAAIAERRSRTGAAHPLFWGAFVLVGDAGRAGASVPVRQLGQ